MFLAISKRDRIMHDKAQFTKAPFSGVKGCLGGGGGWVLGMGKKVKRPNLGTAQLVNPKLITA